MEGLEARVGSSTDQMNRPEIINQKELLISPDDCAWNNED